MITVWLSEPDEVGPLPSPLLDEFVDALTVLVVVITVVVVVVVAAGVVVVVLDVLVAEVV